MFGKENKVEEVPIEVPPVEIVFADPAVPLLVQKIYKYINDRTEVVPVSKMTVSERLAELDLKAAENYYVELRGILLRDQSDKNKRRFASCHTELTKMYEARGDKL